MSQKEIKEFTEYMLKRIEEVSNSPKAAEDLLKRAGILTEDGAISERFKGLERNVPR